MSEERRGLLTETERKILLEEKEVDESYYYTTVSRVRKKIKLLENDLPALKKQGDLYSELKEVVCQD